MCARLHVIADGDRAALGVRANHVAHQKIAAAKFVLIFAQHAPHVQPAAHQLLLAVLKCLIDLMQALHRGLAGELEDHVTVGPGDHKRTTDRPAALRHNGSNSNWTVDDRRNRTFIVDFAAEQEPVLARSPAAAGHAPDNRHHWLLFVELGDQYVGGKAEWLTKQ